MPISTGRPERPCRRSTITPIGSEHDQREVQEDHRTFAVQVMARVALIDPGLGPTEAKQRAAEDLMLLLFRAKIVSEAWRAERLPGVLPSFQAFLSPSASTSAPERP